MGSGSLTVYLQWLYPHNSFIFYLPFSKKEAKLLEPNAIEISSSQHKDEKHGSIDQAAIHNANILLHLKSGQHLGEHKKRSQKSLTGMTHFDQEFPWPILLKGKTNDKTKASALTKQKSYRLLVKFI